MPTAIKIWSAKTRARFWAENSVCDDTTDPNYSPNPDDRICYQDKEVPVNQGIFVHDIDTNKTRHSGEDRCAIR